MSLLIKIKSGAGKLSELQIDAAKDWLGFAIRNIGAAVDEEDALRKAEAILQSALTAKGDILYRGDDIAERLPANYGSGYSFLHSGDGGQPQWRDIQDIVAFISGGLNRLLSPASLTAPVPQLLMTIVESHLGGGHLVDRTLDVGVPVLAEEVKTTLVSACGGAVSHNDDVGDADETAQANDAAASDMTLLPSDGAVNDAYLFGHSSQFDAVAVLVGTAGAGFNLAYEYSKGAGVWGTLPVVHNSTSQWQSAAKGWLTFARPTDWATDTIAGIANLYWVRARVISVPGPFTQPLGTQAWILAYP